MKWYGLSMAGLALGTWWWWSKSEKDIMHTQGVGVGRVAVWRCTVWRSVYSMCVSCSHLAGKSRLGRTPWARNRVCVHSYCSASKPEIAPTATPAT